MPLTGLYVRPTPWPPPMSDTLTFLGGVALGAALSGILKIVADAIKDYRTARRADEAELLRAF